MWIELNDILVNIDEIRSIWKYTEEKYCIKMNYKENSTYATDFSSLKERDLAYNKIKSKLLKVK